ncbi:HipA family kinase [Planctomycetota bacterium]
MTWHPTEITRYIEPRQSSTQVVIVDTDAGIGYLKAMGNPEGEHALACDFVGTQLANWFGLRTFDQCIIYVDDVVPIQFLNGKFASPGPALISRAEDGGPWGGEKRQLKTLANVDDVSKLVVFDTWILNRDRHSQNRVNRDNVFLSTETDSHRLDVLAMDHTHCFGAKGELSIRLAEIGNIRDSETYGLFPEFRECLDQDVVTASVKHLATITKETATEIVDRIPPEWDVSVDARNALVDLIVARATYVAENIKLHLWRQRELGFKDERQD